MTEYAKQFPEIELECNFIDSAAMEVITKPTKFDVILTENLFGDIINDEASVITGSLGMLPSASLGEKYRYMNLFTGHIRRQQEKHRQSNGNYFCRRH